MAEGPTFSGYVLEYGNKIGTKDKYLDIESSTQTGTEGQHPNIEPDIQT
ncbi:15080_t:CDS:2, partial [Racocetra persica]